MAIRTISLFTGYGGLDIGLHRAASAEVKTVVAVEIEAYAAANLASSRVQSALGPFAIWSDVRTFDGSQFGAVDCVTAGIPCQPWSSCGKRSGTADERWLWRDVWRVVLESRAAMLVLECTPNLRRGGLPVILDDLTGERWSAEWATYTAAEAGAPHRRARLFLVAWRVSDADRVALWFKPERMQRERGSERKTQRAAAVAGVMGQDVAAADVDRFAKQRTSHNDDRRDAPRHDADGRSASMVDAARKRSQVYASQRGDAAQEQPTAKRAGRCVGYPPGPDDREGWRSYLAAGGPEPGLPRGYHGRRDRVDRVRLLGNGVVPDQAALAIRDLVARALL